MLFRGVNHLSVDAKGRLAIPAKYRDRLREDAGGLVLTVDFESCLLLYTASEWQVIEQRLMNLPTMDPQARSLQRLLVGYATECEMDGHSRILLPQPLREYAGIDKRVVLVGQMNKLELWDEEVWLSMRDQWVELARPTPGAGGQGSALADLKF
jgi:MraZ protein